jgi:hypothetical protein
VVDDEVFRSAGFLDVQALRLLRAFFRIDDPRLRQQIIERAEELARPQAPPAPPAPDEADR